MGCGCVHNCNWILLAKIHLLSIYLWKNEPLSIFLSSFSYFEPNTRVTIDLALLCRYPNGIYVKFATMVDISIRSRRLSRCRLGWSELLKIEEDKWLFHFLWHRPHLFFFFSSFLVASSSETHWGRQDTKCEKITNNQASLMYLSWL